MYYAPMSFPGFLLLIIAFVFYMHKHRNKKGNFSASFPKKVPQSDPSRIQSVINAHRDCTAEIIDVCSYKWETTPVTMKHIPGDRVELKMDDGAVTVFIDGTLIAHLYYLENSRLEQIVRSRHKFYAYIFDRDMRASSPNRLDFLTIIVFYKLDGEPPTKVTINS